MDATRQTQSDVIVVGTGPGGATVARELARRGKEVLMLEWGPGGPVRGTLGQAARELLMPGKGLLITSQLLGMVRGITTGGSSLFYYATCFPVPFEMFARHGIDLAEDVEELRRELPIGPLKDEMMTPMATRLMESAREVGFDWRRLDKFMFQDRWRPEYPFGYYGDAHGVKWSARMFVDDAVEHGAVLLNNAKVERVVVENGEARGVEYTLNGQRRTAVAPVVVIAAGGIGSPLILRQSGIREAGDDFFFDPLVTVCGTLKDVALRANEIPMSAGVHVADDGYVMTDMAITPVQHAIFTAMVMHPSKIFAFRNTARIMIKIRDDLGGRVTDRGGVSKKLTDADRGKLRAGDEAARRILKQAGATDVYRTGYVAAHPGGTVKIGQLVDSDLQTRHRNLYVCDCSVIPEPWGLPPVLSLLGLGRRLARHLVGEQAQRGEVEQEAPRRIAAG
jgi:choline dehydrogenase-like flavoprotein